MADTKIEKFLKIAADERAQETVKAIEADGAKWEYAVDGRNQAGLMLNEACVAIAYFDEMDLECSTYFMACYYMD